MPLLGNCCFFLDLKVGTLIIGVICLISALTNTLSWAIACVMISFIHSTTSAAEATLKNDDLFLSNAGGGGGGFPGFSSDDDEYTDVADTPGAAQREASAALMEWFNHNMNIVKILAFFLLAYSLVLVIAASMLISGVRKNRRGFLFPWIILEGVKTALLLIGGITLFAVFGGNEIIVYTGLSFFVAVGLEIYFIIVVVSQYQALGIIRMHDEHALDMK